MFDEAKINALETTVKGYIKVHNSEHYPDIGSVEYKNVSENKKIKNAPEQAGLLTVNYKPVIYKICLTNNIGKGQQKEELKTKERQIRRKKC